MIVKEETEFLIRIRDHLQPGMDTGITSHASVLVLMSDFDMKPIRFQQGNFDMRTEFDPWFALTAHFKNWPLHKHRATSTAFIRNVPMLDEEVKAINRTGLSTTLFPLL